MNKEIKILIFATHEQPLHTNYKKNKLRWQAITRNTDSVKIMMTSPATANAQRSNRQRASDEMTRLQYTGVYARDIIYHILKSGATTEQIQ